MPDLESKVDAWRRELLAEGMSAETAAELESHLRDDIASQIKSGVAESEAFEDSVRNLGPSAELKTEFKKIGSFRRLAARTRDTMLSLAGIPNHYAFMNESSLNFPSRWSTYLRSALFLLPALVLWSLAAVFVVPKFHSLWDKAGWDQASVQNAANFFNYLRFDLNVMALFKDNFLFIALFSLVALVLLEWRFRTWPRYRRAVFGSIVFLINLVILFSFLLMFVGATLVATQFATHVK